MPDTDPEKPMVNFSIKSDTTHNLKKNNKQNHNKLFVSVPNYISSSGTREIFKVFLQIKNLHFW